MKNLIKLIALWGLITISAYSCKKENVKLPLTSGYIVGFDPCSELGYRIGYVFVSEDLRDTLITYNISDAIYKMPASVVFSSDTLYKIPWIYFQDYCNTAYFPDSLRYKYRIKVSYVVANINEMIYYPCTNNCNDSDFNNALQVIIKSAVKE